MVPRAAEQGYAPAQYLLSSMYYNGQGVATDFSEAAKWVQRAAMQGDARAQADLGYLYEQGRGVPLDYVSAYQWYSLAVENGDANSKLKLKNLSQLMTQRQVTEAAAIRVYELEKNDPTDGGISNAFAKHHQQIIPFR